MTQHRLPRALVRLVAFSFLCCSVYFGFAGTGASDFLLPSALGPVAPWLRVLGGCVLVPAVAAAAIHVALAITGKRELERAMSTGEDA